MSVKATDSLTIGLDIGIASVGWAVLAPNRIVALGVRAFDKAETAKEGDSLNLVRRTARLMRRRLHRRAWRLKKLTRLLKRHGLVDDTKAFHPNHPFSVSLWKLRVEALNRQLSTEEWARVIYHICKHRGFHWTSRAEEQKADEDIKGESGKVKQGLAGTAQLMKAKNYRTAAEMVLAEFPGAQRNKQGEYKKALSRVLLADELKQLFDQQRKLNNAYASTGLETEILGNGDRKTGLFWEQKPALAGNDLLKMLGKCTFEKTEYRAPKASFTAERHVWLTRLNNLRIVIDGTTRSLNEQERRLALPLPYQQAGDFTYKQLCSALVKAGYVEPDKFKFAGLSYPSEKQKSEGNAKDPEKAALVKLPAWQKLQLLLKKAGLETEWQGMAAAAVEGRPDLLDQIAWVLSVYKEDEEVSAELRKLLLPGGDKMIDALLTTRFDKFHALSLKALRQIVPRMETGLRYDEACERAGYHHSQLHKAGEGEGKYLPSLYSGRDKSGRIVFSEDLDIPRNPVVLRALNQARKVVNALVREYGAPHAVHIEMARDLSRPLDERRKIEKDQAEYRDQNEKDRSRFEEHFGSKPKGAEFEKWRLYREQQGKCAYSVEAIDIDRLLEPGYVEVDHALPYSRSFDDSKNNKVLVHAKENRDKGNQTPYEYLRGAEDSDRWRTFVAFVESTKAYRLAKRSRLLRKDFGSKEAEEFKERNLNDTRYICRFFKNYVERFLKLADGSDAKRCVVVSGQLTSMLRARWGLLKVRSDSDRHHALDAAVVAACSHGMVKRMSDYARRKELDQVREGFADAETGEIVNPAMYQKLHEHFPDPWPHFRDEVESRLKVDDPIQMRTELERLGSYPPEALHALRPLFVSRAPQRRNGGGAHLDTIYSISRDDREKQGLIRTDNAIQRIPINKLTEKQLGDIVGSHDERNAGMIETLRNWLQQRNASEKRAKEIEASVGRGKEKRELTTDEKMEIARLRELPHKPTKDGSPGPLIRAVKINTGKMSGIQIRHGLAAQESLVRLDVYTKDNQFYLIPLYAADKIKKELPDRTADGKTRLDRSFNFLFSLHPNDLAKITLKGKGSILGYFRGYGGPPNPYNITLLVHDRNKNGHERANENGEIPSIGVKTALALEKFHVDVLGNIFPAPPEKRLGLA